MSENYEVTVYMQRTKVIHLLLNYILLSVDEYCTIRYTHDIYDVNVFNIKHLYHTIHTSADLTHIPN